MDEKRSILVWMVELYVETAGKQITGFIYFMKSWKITFYIIDALRFTVFQQNWHLQFFFNLKKLILIFKNIISPLLSNDQLLGSHQHSSFFAILQHLNLKDGKLIN